MMMMMDGWMMIVVDDDDDNDVNYHESDDGGDDNGDGNDDEDNNNNNYYCDADDWLSILINPYIHTSNYQAYILSTTLSRTAVAINQSINQICTDWVQMKP